MRFFLSVLSGIFENFFNIPSHLFQIVLHGRELLHGSVKYGLVQLDSVNLFVLVFQFGFYTRAPVRQRLDPCDVVKVLDVHGNQKRRDNSKRLYVVADKFLDLWHRLSKCQYDRQRFRDGLYQFDSRF